MDTIKKIVIVGGGSAGWMSAATFAKFYPSCSITVIESPNIPTVGVGESTLGQIRNWLYALGIQEEDFLVEVDGSYKLGIKFTDFYKKDSGSFYYPFGTPFITPDTPNNLNTWHVKKVMYPSTPADDYCKTWYSTIPLMDTNKFTPNLNFELPGFRSDVNLAYHFDAVKFANWLRDSYCIPRNVAHLKAEVEHVSTSENGIDYLTLTNGETVTGDLFVDCTGFKSLLLNKTLNEPFLSLEHILPNNKAWATQIPYTDKDAEMEPYTNCTAIGNGWVWNIPSWSRIGTGYVYSDKFVTPEEALEEFKAYLVSDKMTVIDKDRVKNLKFKELSFTPGIHRRVWVKNVVAIGLSAGFIEPLESNGLYTTHEFLLKLMKSLTRLTVTQWDRDVFNYAASDMFNNFAEFVALHYALTNRDDTEYWRDITNKSFNGELGTIVKKETFADGFFKLAEKKMFTQEFIGGGMHCIATGMNYPVVDQVGISAWELHYDKDLKKRVDLFISDREIVKREWVKIAEKSPTLHQFLKEKYYAKDSTDDI